MANICRGLRKFFFLLSSPQVTYPYRIYWCKKMGQKSHTWAPLIGGPLLRAFSQGPLRVLWPLFSGPSLMGNQLRGLSLTGPLLRDPILMGTLLGSGHLTQSPLLVGFLLRNLPIRHFTARTSTVFKDTCSGPQNSGALYLRDQLCFPFEQFPDITINSMQFLEDLT
jgi:hypothetical protein